MVINRIKFFIRVLFHSPWQFAVIKKNMDTIVGLPYSGKVFSSGLGNLYSYTQVFIFVFFLSILHKVISFLNIFILSSFFIKC